MENTVITVVLIQDGPSPMLVILISPNAEHAFILNRVYS